MTLVTTSSKNQVTIPAAYLRDLGLKPGEHFLIDNKGKELIFKPIKGSIVDELAGSLEKFIPADKKKISIEKAIRLAKIMHAKELGAKLNSDH